MTIPNVYMNWCQRKAVCKWCNSTIEAGEPMVTVFFWNKGNEDVRRWNTKQYYHVKDKAGCYCWIEQGMDYLKMNPYVPYIRHKKTVLTKKQSEHRVILLRRKAALDQRRRGVKADYPERILVDARIDTQVARLMVEIAQVGGVPKKWLENMT